MIHKTTACTALVAMLTTGSLMAAALPSEVGQDAFAALSEIVEALTEDPTTDWSQVDLLALREHLVDMDEVVMRAVVRELPIDGGVRLEVAGEGRTLEALRRMIPMHGHMMQGETGWQVSVDERPDGYQIDLTSAEPGGVDRLRGLGFFGFLAAGGHHQRHHLGVATGGMTHHRHGGQ